MSEEIDFCIVSLDFSLRGPDVGEIDGLAVFVFADGIFAEVDIDASGERKSDDQRRRHQIIRADFGIDAAFEIAIAGKHRGDHQIVFIDGLRNFFGQRAGVSDAGGAAVSHDVEFQLFEIVQ